MNSTSELNQLYEIQLKERTDLQKFIRNKYILSSVFFIGSTSGIIVLWIQNVPLSLLIPAILVTVSFFIYSVYQTSVKAKNLGKSFKSGLAAGLIRLINNGWQFQSESFINKDIYRQSGLFTHSCEQYTGGQLISGKCGDVDFRFSDLRVRYKRVKYNNQGKLMKKWITIFEGLFMYADFNTELFGTTYILPDKPERVLGSYAQNLNKLKIRDKLGVQINPEFEKKFVVHSSDQLEAGYILTPALTEALVHFTDHLENSIQFSFVGSKVYCAISFDTSIFKPTLFHPDLSFDTLKEMHDLLNTIGNLIRIIKLNAEFYPKYAETETMLANTLF